MKVGTTVNISVSGRNCKTIEVFMNNSSIYAANGNSVSFNYYFASEGTYSVYAVGTSTTDHTANSDTLTINVVSDAGTGILTVTYDINGGNGIVPSPQSFQAGDPVTLAALTDPRSCYRLDHGFVGWNTKSDGTGISYMDGESAKFSSNVTLYAIFKYAIDAENLL